MPKIEKAILTYDENQRLTRVVLEGINIEQLVEIQQLCPSNPPLYYFPTPELTTLTYLDPLDGHPYRTPPTLKEKTNKEISPIKETSAKPNLSKWTKEYFDKTYEDELNQPKQIRLETIGRFTLNMGLTIATIYGFAQLIAYL